MSQIAAVILAAGRSTRFGGGAGTKVLAELSGMPLVRRVAEAALSSRARPVIVVTGHAAEKTRAALQGCDIEIVHAAEYAAGLSRSLKAGLTAVPAVSAGAVVLLADMPLISAMLINDLIDVFESATSPVTVVPTYDGRRGNPVILSRTLFAEIATLDGDRGASQILKGRDGVIEWPVADPSILADVDTLDDLQRLRSFGTDSRLGN